MRNAIIKDLLQTIELMKKASATSRQIQHYEEILKIGESLKCVSAFDVLEDYQLEYIEHVLKPEPKECFRNAHLLTEAFPEITYCEGLAAVPFVIDHAFNKVGDAYIDITFEFALGDNPRQYDYFKIAEYEADEIAEAAFNTGYYGGYYNYFCRKNQSPDVE